MSRPLRIEYPHALYHITSRGNGRNKIYLNDKDYNTFLTVFSDVIKRYNWICYAYCLMPNHYHLLIETPEANLSRGMRQLNGVYTQKFNYFNKSVGHVFQGRFKAILVEKNKYIGELIRYIALNPVKARIVKTPGQYKWSSHNEIIGKKKPTVCVDVKSTLKLFHQNNIRAKKEYLDFINERSKDDVWDDLKSGVILGTIKFVEKISCYLKKQGDAIEIPRKERLAHRPSLRELFKNYSSKKKRNILVYDANIKYAYSLAQIGKQLGLHYTTISNIIKKENEKGK